MKLKQYLYVIIMPFRQLYWRICKPKTFGVKVLITHPQDSEKILLLRHTYGNTKLWNIPGGGYNPKKELATDAASREVFEEVGVTPINLQEVGEYKTSGEGKRDTVTLFTGTITTADLVLNNEIAEVKWRYYHDASSDPEVARVARRTISATFPPS